MRYAFLVLIAPLACAAPQHTEASSNAIDSGEPWTGSFSAAQSSRGLQFELDLRRPKTRDNIGLARYGLGLPAPGRYKLGLFDRSTPGGFYAAYSRGAKNPSDTVFSYVSISGEVVITSSSSQRVEGTMHFTGAEYSAGWRTGRTGSGSPDKVEANAPTIDVSASFTATPFSSEMNHVCLDVGGPSVLVEVRDVNRRPAAAGATLEIREKSFRNKSGGSGDGLHLGAGDGRPGIYEGRVTKPWYKPVTIHAIQAPADTVCHYAVPTDIRKVTLELLPNAPPVRQVLIGSGSWSLGVPDRPEGPIHAFVDADPGVSTEVMWSSTDTTVVKVLQTGVIIPQCRRGRGIARVIARSVVNPQAMGSITVDVDPIRDSRGLSPQAARDKADECQRRLGRIPPQ